MELEMSTESEAMFARKPKRWIKFIRRQLVEHAIEEKGISRQAAEDAVHNAITDEVLLHATFGTGITAEQVSDGGFGSWIEWLRDRLKGVDWLSVVIKLLPLIFLFLANRPAVAPCDTGDAE